MPQQDQADENEFISGDAAATVATKVGLLISGFRGFMTLHALLKRGVPPDPALRNCGVYAVVTPPGYEPAFVPPEVARERGNVLRPWPVERLRDKWVARAETVYIGIAGVRTPRALAERLTELARHASGRTGRNGPHKGGEILWQLESFEAFEVGYLPTGGPPAPRKLERALLRAFREATGKLPFANRKW